MDDRRVSWTDFLGRFSLRSPRARAVASAACIAVVVALHFGLRWREENRRPLAQMANTYPNCYSRSLSLVFGRGYERLPVADDQASQPIKDFLDCQRGSLTKTEIADYLASVPAQRNVDLGNYRQVDLMRTGDLLTAALVWKVFGVKWLALTRFYIFVSALACLAIFAATRRISGSFAAGITAALLYATCGYERTQVIRDTNPIWFVAFATYALTLLGGRLSASTCAGRGLLLGALAVLGQGWRPQLMFFAPFFLVAALVRRRLEGDGFRKLFATSATFAAGAAAVYGGLYAMSDPPDDNNVMAGFHVAYFGEFARAAVAGAENDLQICYDDSKVAADVYLYRAGQGLPTSKPYDLPYSASVRDMYFESLRHHLAYWMRSLPEMIVSAVSGRFAGQDFRLWSIVATALFFCGLPALGVRQVDRIAMLLLLTIMGFYFGIWFGISPEARHWGAFLVPVCIIAGLATTVLSHLRQWLRAGSIAASLRDPHAWYLPAGCAACVVVWLGACFIADRISSEARSEYWQAAIAAKEKGEILPVDAWSPTQFEESHAQGETAFQYGYWLEIDAGKRPAELQCRHLRSTSNPMDALFDWDGNPPGSGTLDRVREVLWWNTFTKTKHALQPQKKQIFFVTIGREPSCGDQRSYSLNVSLSGDARITSVRRCTLNDWRRLQVSTVFQPEAIGVTPYVGDQASMTLGQFIATPKQLAEFGFSNAAHVAIQPADNFVR